jgi:hypothetical protein
MAYWNRRRNNHVFVYTSVGGKQSALPRSETMHLDTEPDHNIDTWVHNWSLTHEHQDNSERTVLTDAKTLELVEHFCTYLMTIAKDKGTVSEHRGNLINYVLPYFIYKCDLKDPQLWPNRSVKLVNYLREELGLKAKHINACNTAIRQMWKWMVEERIVSEASLLLRSGGKISRNTTPLRKTITPDQLLNHKFKDRPAELLALLGYFFSLRPQEIIALRPRDFRAGMAAAQLECCKVMAQSDLYNKLAVLIEHQREGSEPLRIPKASSRGAVACFDRKAAARIVSLLNELPPEEFILPYTIFHYYRYWRENGYSGITLKDLRRSSLYYLGHYTEMSPVGLMNHARHTSLDTTSLYLRRPEENTTEWSGLNLDS